jgi:hypothetical protein
VASRGIIINDYLLAQLLHLPFSTVDRRFQLMIQLPPDIQTIVDRLIQILLKSDPILLIKGGLVLTSANSL